MLTTETELIYKVTGAHDKAAERGVIWKDPDIGMKSPVPAEARGRAGRTPSDELVQSQRLRRP
jgi:dTDP-4-dehydrorhamnose 3,5-epimerase-like enzyme